jgi:hypothetical protein
MSYVEEQAAIAEFIRTKGVVRCPTACLTLTCGSVTPADKLALLQHAQQREELRKERLRSMNPWLLPRAREAGVHHADR